MNLNWKQIMSTVEGDDRFYMDTEEDEVTPKEAGWEFLRMFGKDQGTDEESEEESVYSENSEQEESVSYYRRLLFWRSSMQWNECSYHIKPLTHLVGGR